MVYSLIVMLKNELQCQQSSKDITLNSKMISWQGLCSEVYKLVHLIRVLVLSIYTRQTLNGL